MPPSINESQENELKELLRSGRKLQAVKLYKEWAGCRLKEAKKAVESMDVGGSGENGSPVVKTTRGCAVHALILIAIGCAAVGSVLI